ncbi:uncharacterized protein DUF3616 [Saccharopolyspora erythraea NRRL 2338]|uniref:Uncharacterized protein n=2 Tax=Saccharopolyspora erythraea TaxID=1836 RepID=A4FFF2_SACEN|nr:DUF3616 domain-containing protein [Saccharopolyspora erythraea]EQD82723.1 hypothetical protein N599_29125 [Saccharopolyspora erythraea D]PFG96498.1 uncharacterized protein DUF3616 [Saccharopolyspora erythraea NRRL 2338]QRK92991.1 DUF3616 domain-containing protein [Saccharopolyspora erythraea]CAM02777.1 hypothetical protein SACE_3503 [Saccharopolyspora erythraea NRRL 2338]
MSVERTVALRFAPGAVEAGTHVNLSAVRTDGEHLWIAGDETATVERLTCDSPQRPVVYTDHVEFALADVVALPGEADEEVDVEGLALNGPYLWAVGSHSRRRKRVKSNHSDRKAAKRLAAVTDEPSRRVLARIALSDHVPAGATPEGHRSAALSGPGLVDLLDEDEHLAPFLAIPGKDNGLDVEGIAVAGEPGAERVFLGLRGPVLRGWAVVLQVAPREDGDELRLAPVEGKQRYLKHFLDLDGLGIRDLCPQGDDLLVLAGPSMDLDGPVRVYRWPGAARIEAPDVVHRDELRREIDLPYGEGDDHAEGIALLPSGELLVVYDSPARSRLTDPGTVLADVVAAGGR